MDESEDRRCHQFVIIESAMAQSPLAKLWDIIKPPPAVAGENETRKGLNPAQKRMIWGTVAAIVLIVGGWQVYAYVLSLIHI